jgi:hypothetical protein
MNQLTPITETDVQILEEGMLQLPQAECSVVHKFGPGIYIREVTIPADTFSIGHRQTTAHMNIMLTGRVTMIREDGRREELMAPQTFVCGPGRKIGYIHETMIWQNVYATTETDVAKLEAMFIDKSPTWQTAQRDRQLLLSCASTLDQEDYYAAIAELGFDHATVRAQSENPDDQIPFPYGGYPVQVAPSPIEGSGLFATSNIDAHQVIAPARIDGMRTPAGRYANHSTQPNAVMVQSESGDVYLMSSRPIAGCKGGDLGEEITICYRQAVRSQLKGY